MGGKGKRKRKRKKGRKKGRDYWKRKLFRKGENNEGRAERRKRVGGNGKER